MYVCGALVVGGDAVATRVPFAPQSNHPPTHPQPRTRTLTDRHTFLHTQRDELTLLPEEIWPTRPMPLLLVRPFAPFTSCGWGVDGSEGGCALDRREGWGKEGGARTRAWLGGQKGNHEA